MSLKELAAAIRPKVIGSSTMGVKKSTVCTRARFGARSAGNRYTPASSAVSKPTRTLGSDWRGKRDKTESKILGLNLAAQPAAFTIVVKRARSSMGFIIGRVKSTKLRGVGQAKSNGRKESLRKSAKFRRSCRRRGFTSG